MTTPPSQPEQTFFADPAMDRLMGIVLNLASEVHVLRDRTARLEQVLEARGGLSRGELDAFVPDPATRQALDADRQAFVAHVLSPVLGAAASRSA